ncbi:MAG: M14-type cytosolic carboxypeptidase, partial [Ignavibacteria bacterium]
MSVIIYKNAVKALVYFIIFTALILTSNQNISAQISIDTSFEGANARVLSINNAANTVKIESRLRTGDIHNVVFYCKISGFNVKQPLKIQVKYTQLYYLPVLAAYSYDQINWYRFSGTIVGDSKEFTRTYSQSPVYFAHGYPYVYTDLLNLVSNISFSPFVQISNLATSFGGRNVKLVKITEPCVPDSGKYLVWLLGRNHAMESHSNYVIVGMINFLVSNDIKADRLRRQAIIYIVPVMDVDNAAIGGTGKDRLPVDFNRDWDGPSYWPAVIAVKQKLAETVSLNPLKIFIDSHNPFPGSPGVNERLFFYSLYSSGPKSINLDFYRKLFFENGSYALDRQPAYATNGQTSARYVDSMYSALEFSSSLETGWVNRTDNLEWTIPLYKLNGEMLGKTINDYLSNLIRPGDVIVDNTDSSGVIITGQWFPSTNVSGYWGSNYLHDGNIDKGSKSVKYSPSITSEGFYEVFLRWTQDAARANNTPVRIAYNGGIKDTNVNQQTRGAEWVPLGIYNFTSGSIGNILIQTTGTSGFVIADAVRLSKRNTCSLIGIINNNFTLRFSISAYPNPFNP